MKELTVPVAARTSPDTAARRRGPAAGAVLLVFFASGIALSVPAFSSPIAVFAASVTGLVLVEAFVFLTDRWRNRYWGWAWLILLFDALCLLGATATWRMLGGAAWTAGAIGATLVVGAAVGHLARRRILQELYAPQTSLGIAVVALGAVGAGTAGGLTFVSGRIVGATVLAFAMLLAVLFLLVVIHATWLKVEDPAWAPRQPRRRRPSTGLPRRSPDSGWSR